MTAVIRTFAACLLAAALLASAGCAGPDAPDDQPTVVVTIFPVADLVAQVAGASIRVTTLLPPRASPATWEATPGQVRALTHAAGYVTVGGGLDGWLEDFPAGAARLTLTDGMELRNAGHDHGSGQVDDASGDPHVWLDPILVRDELLPRIEAFLAGVFPEEAGGLAARRAMLADTLTRLDQEIRAVLRSTPRRSFVATHDAWSYFSARYGLESLGSIYERPGHEPSVRGMAMLVRAAREAGVDVILAEPQLAQSGARSLAVEIGASVRIVDPIGGPGLTGRESYTEMMRSNAREFARALGAG